MTDSSIVMITATALVSAAVIVKSSVDAIARIVTSKRQRAPDGDSASDARLARLEVAVESIAVEIERISEGQRFTTRLLSTQFERPTPRLERADKFDTPH
jgi:hypothetical protein